MMNKSRSYPLQDIPSGAFGKALHYDKTHFKNVSNTRTPVDPWEKMGPINTAGRCLALAVNPQADSTIYMGTASGGLWRSRKLGQDISWEYVPTDNGVLGVSSIAFANADSMVMYIGTGEVYNSEVTGNDGAYRATRGSYGVGILKSIDGGITWSKSLDWSYQNQKGVQAIKVNPENSNIIFAATTDGVYRSLDAGTNWELVLDVIMATDIEILGTKIIAACGNLGSPNRGIYRSVNNGNNWTQNTDPDIPTTFQGKILLASAASNPDIVYASVGNGFGFSDGATWLLRSEDSGINWELKNTEDYSQWQGWFAHDIAVHPNDPDYISAVGIDIYGSQDGGETLVKKSNGGVTLGTPPAGSPDGDPFYSHSDHHVTLFHPNIPDLVLYGNDGGLFLSEDGGNTFKSANGGLQSTQFYNGFAVSHQNPDFAMGGLQDNSTVINRGDGLWQRAIGGDGSWSGINFQNDQIIYGSAQNLYMTRSNDNGQSFFNISPGLIGNPVFIAPYQISESNPDVIYAAESYIHKSTDGGFSWSVMNGFQPLNGEPIYALTVSPINNDVVFAATAPFEGGGSTFVTTNGGLNWQDISNGLPDRYINDLYADPNDEATVYAVMSGFGTGHVFVSDDFGQNWNDITGTLPDVPTNAVLVDPKSEDDIYIGNDIGVYFSEDGGSNWIDFNEGLLETVIAMDLEYSPLDEKIWVATHGNGAFRRDVVGETTSTEEIDMDELISNIQVYPNPLKTGQSLNVDFELLNNETLEFLIFDQTGKQLYTEISNLTKGQNQKKIESESLIKGIYQIVIQTKNNIKKSQTFIVQ